MREELELTDYWTEPEETDEVIMDADEEPDFESTGDELPADILPASSGSFYDAPLLTAEEEIECAKAIKSARLAEKKVKENPELEKKYRAVIEAGRQAKEKLVCSNLRLVVSVARTSHPDSMSQDDLIQEGCLGLMKAAGKYDNKRGCRFSTYAFYWIRQSISRAIIDSDRLIRYPAYKNDELTRYTKFCTSFVTQNGRTPSDSEASEALNVTVEAIAGLRGLVERPVSLNTFVGKDDDEELGNLIEDRASANPEHEFFNDELHKIIAKVMDDVLNDKEQVVIKMRFGLDDMGAKTLRETGEVLAISRERVRQIEDTALRKLKTYMKKKEGNLIAGYAPWIAREEREA